MRNQAAVNTISRRSISCRLTGLALALTNLSFHEGFFCWCRIILHHLSDCNR
jgi:hypothetical protein